MHLLSLASTTGCRCFTRIVTLGSCACFRMPESKNRPSLDGRFHHWLAATQVTNYGLRFIASVCRLSGYSRDENSTSSLAQLQRE